MKRMLYILAVLLLWALPGVAISDESAAKEIVQFSDEEIVKTVEGYVKEHSVESGTFDIFDVKEQMTRKLSLEQVQDGVRKTGEHYIVSVDFKDTESGDNLNIDIVLGDMEGALKVVDARIHKINGIPRDSYNSEGVYMPSGTGVVSSEQGPSATSAEQPVAQPGSQVPQGSSEGNFPPGGAATTGNNSQPASSGESSVTVVPSDSGPQF